jgi:hypothetical protein
MPAAAARFLVYPNPASSQVSIQFPPRSDPAHFQVILSNSLGQTVVRKVFLAADPASISVGNLPESIYFLTISELSPKGPVKLFNTKLVVIH